MTKPNVNTAIFDRKYHTVWVRHTCGRIASYRFDREEHKEKTAAILSDGSVRIQDPFRKGAPAGGYSNNREHF